MKQIAVILLLLFIGSTVWAQATFMVKGKVHREDGTVISHVTIRVEGTDLLAITDEKGLYQFDRVPAGLQTLLVSSVEIETKRIPLRVSKNYPDLHIHVDPKGDISLDEVKITRNTAKKELEISGFAVSIIETEQASLRNLTTNELLDRSVGVRVRQNGGEGSPIEYNLNGMTGNAIGIFLDGLELSTYGSSFNLNNIPPAMIDRIEVYKGVLPAHLSGNYVGGAINVVLKKDASANNLSAAMSYGSFGTYRADFGGLYRNQKNGFTTRVSGFYSKSDNDYEMWGKFSKYTLPNGRLKRYYRTKRPNDKFETVGGRFEFGFTDVKWADQFFVGYNISDSYKDIPHGLTMTTPYFGRFNEYQAQVVTLNYAKKDLLLPGLSLHVNAAYSKRNTYLQDTVSQRYNWDGSLLMGAPNEGGVSKPQPHQPGKGQQGDAVMTDIDRNIYNVRTNLGYMIADGHRVSLNHKFEYNKRNDQDLLNPEKSRWITQSDLRDQILALNYEAETFNKRLRTNVFGKYALSRSRQLRPEKEVNGDILFQELISNRDNKGFGATVSYQAIREGYIILSAEKSFIMPTDRHVFGEPENNLLPNADIVPERAINYNLGARYALNSEDLHRWGFYGNFFWRNGYDKIMLQTRVDPVLDGRENQVEDIQVSQFINLPRTQSLGFEAEVNYIYNNKLNVMLNVSKFNSLFKVKTDERGQPNSLYNLQLPNEPYFMANANVQYRLNNIFQKNSVLNIHYASGYVAPFSTIWIESEWFTTPRQFTHDLGLSYRFPKGKLVASLDGKNLLNAEIYDNFGVQKPGRAVYLKLNYTLSNFIK